MKNIRFSFIAIQMILCSFLNPLQSYSVKKNKLTTTDIISKDIIYSNSFRKRVFNHIAGFNGKTYTKKVNFYIHNFNGYNEFKLLNRNYAYSISNDAEEFIEDVFKKLDRYIDLDFKRVYSRSEAMIEIYKTNISGLKSGMAASAWAYPYKYKVEIEWAEKGERDLTLKQYSNLSSIDAHTILHEIGHALGLDHDKRNNFNPYDKKFNISDTLMSYNSYGYLKDDIFFTVLDLQALQEIWGSETSNLNKTNTKKNIKKKINNKRSIKNKSLFEIAYEKAQKGNHLEAISIYSKLLKKDPYNINALRNRGKSKETLGDLASACSDWFKASSLGDIYVRYWIKEKC